MAAELPEWMLLPRPSGREADDPDRTRHLHRDRIKVTVAFPVDIDLGALTP
ncbi:hypothetical protein [Streptomyces vinaceus]|uniref:hypothetical protein n=1 Tax=Streptomyces vinaceus TaxID=1960 RepID=UPI0037F2B300